MWHWDIGAFSGHGESSRMFVDSSTKEVATHIIILQFTQVDITDYITVYTEREDQLKYTFLVL